MANYRGPSKDRRYPPPINVFQQWVQEYLIQNNYATLEDIPENVGAFINDVGYVTFIPPFPVTSVNGQSGDVILSLFSGNYNDLVNKPTLFSGAYNDLTGKPVLFSGSYLDLTNKPTIPSAQVNSDWNSSSGVSQILNKPTIPAAQVQSNWTATTGLGVILNKPTIPTTTSQLTNDSGFITAASLRKVETFLGTTNASGNYTVTYATPYPSVPDVQPQLQAGTPAQVVRITSSTTTGFTVNVTNRASVTLLAIEVLLAATTPVSGASVSVLVTAR